MNGRIFCKVLIRVFAIFFLFTFLLIDIPFFQILRTVIIHNQWVYIDLWSIAHLISGAILAIYFSQKEDGDRLKYSFVIYVVAVTLMAYELVEPSIPCFMGQIETGLNVAWDIIIGMLGCLIVIIIKSKKGGQRENNN